ncbi:MAG: carbohydrate binding domain-containing protein [Lachnospiraceae bacterium]|nr:carbohydrate binding domain-containing protein [Lachnospiraceae bacterium]
MTIKNKKIAKRACAVMLSMAMAMPVGIPAMNVKADEPTDISPAPIATDYANAYKDEGYSLVWNDEFDGDSLNLDDWNVEEHAPGWVNAELQAYPDKDNMEDNISVKDGILKITPTAEKKAKGKVVDVLESKSFDATWNGSATATVENGKATLTVAAKNAGNPWDVQYQKAGMTLEEGKEYTFSMKAKSDVARKITLNIANTTDYSSYGGETFTVGTTEEEYTYSFKMGKCDPEKVAIQFNLGKIDETVEGGAAATIELYDAKLTDSASGSNTGELLEGNGFDETWDGSATATVENGKATLTVAAKDTGDPWDVQYQKAGMTLEEGKEYTFSMKAKSDVARKITLNIANTTDYSSYGGETFTVGTTEEEYTYSFKMGKCDPKKVAIQLNLGKIDETVEGGVAATIELSEVSLVDKTATGNTETVDVKTDYNYTSGRINTQNKHDFTYGRFETRLKVPVGQGYLPAFWLMATDETNYGQWPQCGEIDIMEVMGQETNKSYHTIHYGYNSGAGHRQNQGTKTLDEGDFASEYHTYALDWEPGKLTWYVDGEEVYTTNDWFTGKDEESQLSYPAPFDQNFYIILNLAVGGSWVGYPTQEVVDNIIAGNDDQSFYVDYVRVYQKDEETYAEQEETAEKPVHEIVYREADTTGNYVVNGNFTQELKPMDSKGDNFELHLEADANETTYERKDNEIIIKPSTNGGVDYSIQLKQTGIPMYKGWEYELTYDAYADQARTMIVEIEGPDNGWTRYFDDTKVNLTTEKQTFTHTFTMEKQTDANGSLEFNLGNQDSTAPVHISNIKLVHKSGEKVEEKVEKSVRADGNYIYNGSFDQGDNRLGYWEMSDEDAARVTVTNKTVDGSKNKVRELCAKIEVPEGTSEVNPITISQSELAPIVAGKYEISFDAYMENGGSADAVIVDVAGKEFNPTITTEANHYSKALNIRNSLSRDESNIKITFTKPGTYYLDNVLLIESALLKNGSFNSGISGYEPYINSPAVASYVIDNMNGNNNTFVMSIDSVGDADWHIQLIQDGITLEKNKTYELSFKIKSSVARQVKYDLECNGNLSNPVNTAWDIYSNSEDPIDLTTEWQTITKQFTMEKNTDTATRFKIAMGNIGEAPSVKHDVYVDDIVLKEIGEVLTEEEKQEKEVSDLAAIEPIIEKIKAIGTVDATDACKAKIDEANEAYESLTIDQQDLISDEVYDLLYNAKKEYKTLKKVADDKTAADTVIALIDAIGKVEATDTSKAAIEKAATAYENLTDDQKKLIDNVTVKKLEDASKAYGEAMGAKIATEIKQKEDKKTADEAIAKINAIPATIDASDATKTAIDAAEKAYNALTDDQKKLVDAATAKKITDAKTAYNAAVEAAKTPVAVEPTPSTGNSNNNGVAEAGETAITEQGTFTATSATTATYTPSEAVKNSADVNIPATANIDGQDVPVTEIPKDAFKGDTALKNVTIGANINTIGEGAFQNAANLTTVKFESTKITTIAKNTFAGAKKLKSIDLSKQKKLKTISANAFKGCKKLKTIKIYGNKLTKVNKTAFKGCANKKSVKVTIFAKNKKQYNKVVKMIKKAGLKKVSFKYKKAK